MKRYAWVGVAAGTAAWFAWSLTRASPGQVPFRMVAAVACGMAAALLLGAMLALGDWGLGEVPVRLQVLALAIVFAGAIAATDWRHLDGRDVADLLLAILAISICWRVVDLLVRPAQRRVHRVRARGIRGRRLRVIS
ncbi:MAG TPA: hypothetical protein VFA92_08405 [Candidatus Binatia bacterium]|nr:hypothetical protein [Candidatus Binatia bacterium]